MVPDGGSGSGKGKLVPDGGRGRASWSQMEGGEGGKAIAGPRWREG
jgi:hypothetical protein